MPFLQVASKAFINLRANDPIRMAAATAFFTFFALPPIVIILSQLFGEWLIGDQQWVSGQLFRKLSELVGQPSASQLEAISEQLKQPRSSRIATIVSVVILLMASTTLFGIIKNSLNQLWNVKIAAESHWWYTLVDRLIALGIIVFSGGLFAASLALYRAVTMLTSATFGNSVNYAWIRLLEQHSISILILAIWFGIVFKYLPDIRISWRAVWIGSLVTASLIDLGEWVLGRFLINSSVGDFYGSAGGLILVLLFVFYCSLIFYYGASFTRQYAQWNNIDAEPGAHSVAYEITELDGE